MGTVDKYVAELNDGSAAGMIKNRLLQYCMTCGSQMIPNLAAATGYSIPTVAKYLNELKTDGFIIEQGKITSARGRKPSLYGVNPDACYFIGVDIKQFMLLIAQMNLMGEIVRNKKVGDFNFENTPSVMDAICYEILHFIDEEGIDRNSIMMVNVNISGRVDSKNGYSHSIFNFEDNDAPLADILSEKTGCRVMIENDTRAMTYGEYMSGEVKGYKQVLFVNVSWGIGLGIVMDGKLYYGKDGYCGEFGHMKVYDNGVMCHCGKKGCLETEISGRAIHRKLLERINAGESSILASKVRDKETITMADITIAADRGDMLCIELIEQMGAELGLQLANMINIFNPGIVIIGGTLACAGDYLLSPIRQAIRKYSLKLMNQDIVIALSSLPDNAGVIGACMIARHRVFALV